VRVNQALVRESGIEAESLVGHTLAALSRDPDPRIAKKLVGKLLHGETTAAASSRPYFLN
jgi:hypothetical protein